MEIRFPGKPEWFAGEIFMRIMINYKYGYRNTWIGMVSMDSSVERIIR